MEQEQDLGRQAEEQVLETATLLRDPVVDRYVERLGGELLEAMGPQPFDYTFDVIRDEELNAFAVPAGHIYIHTGLILKARNVSELIGVMGHEVGHVARRHIAQNYNRSRTAGVLRSLGVVAAGVALGGVAADATDLVSGVGLMAYLNQFTREAEREADAYAVEMLPRAGYDAEGIVTFFETLLNEKKANVPTFLSSHPATDERIRNTRALIAAGPQRAGLRRDDGGQLEIVQHRILVLTGEGKADRR